MLQPAGQSQLAPLLVGLYGLTEREREVTELLVRGLALEEIGRALGINVKAIFAKLEVTSRPVLTAKLPVVLDVVRRREAGGRGIDLDHPRSRTAPIEGERPDRERQGHATAPALRSAVSVSRS